MTTSAAAAPLIARATVAPAATLAVRLAVVAQPQRVALSFGERVIQEAQRHYGAPYQWGASGPYRFDCSGFTGYVYRKLGVSLPRVAADQYRATVHVSTPRVGDLIFNHGAGGIFHVGIYAGNGQMIAATHSGDVVRKERLYGAYYIGRIRLTA